MVEIKNAFDFKATSFKKVKSNYILKLIFNNLHTNKLLEIIRYNKKIQNRLNKDIDYYKRYLQIEIEITPLDNIYGNFINISNNDDKNYYHICFNDNKEEIKRNYINKEDKVEKIKILIDYEIKNLYGLFKDCKCIKILNFIQFNRKVNEDMSYLFSRYSSIEEIRFSNFITNNVTNMSYMFYECSSLKKLNLSNFNTNNVTDMRGMFYGCSSLEFLNISNFNTDKVTNMSYMFYKCIFLEELNLKNFKINKLKDMHDIFNDCSLLRVDCSDELKAKIVDYGFKKLFKKRRKNKIQKGFKIVKYNL